MNGLQTPATIPDFLSHLKTYQGLPVPFTQLWAEGKPDFRAVDMERWAQCLDKKLCGICGRHLGEFCYFIGGPRSKESRLFTDAAMHQKCAEFASKTCPFLSGRKLEYSDRPVEHKDALIVKAPMVSERPEVMFIMRTRTAKIRAVKMSGSLLIQAGPWLGLREFAA